MFDFLTHLWHRSLRWSQGAATDIAKRYGWLLLLVLVFFVLRRYEPEIAWTILILSALAWIATKLARLRPYRWLIYGLLAATIVWRPFWIHVFPGEETVTVTSKEDHDGLFVIAAERDDGTTQEYEIRDNELFAGQFNRDYLWSQFQEGKQVIVRYYGVRIPILSLYPKVFYADRIDG